MIECYKTRHLETLKCILAIEDMMLEYFKAMEDTYEDKITQNIEQKRKKWRRKRIFMKRG